MSSNFVMKTTVALVHDEFSQWCLLITVPVVSWWVFKRWVRRGPPLPPGPLGFPLVGNLPILETDLHRCFAKLAQTYGPIMKLQLGPKLCVVVTSSSLAKEVLRDNDAIFANHDPPLVATTMSYGGINIVWSHNDPQWRMMRKAFVHELMSNKSLEACYSLRRKEVRQMVKEVYSKIGTSINISEVASFTMLHLILSLLWGDDALEGDEKSSSEEEIRSVIKGKKLSSRMDHILDMVLSRRLQMDREESDQGAHQKKERKDFLQFLLELKQKDGKASLLTKIQLKAVLQDIVAAGTDPTSATEWTMAEMMEHPEIMRKAQEELEQVVGMDNIVEESHLPKLSYLNAVMKESLRLHPPFPLMIPHCPSQSCTVGGYSIPKGTSVYVNVWAMHRDPNAWENPLTFQPERFLSDGKNYDYKGSNFDYLPFGSGRRMCPGIPLEEKMSIYVLASLLHSFKWQLPDDVKLDFSEEFGIVLKKTTPLVLIPTPRLYNVNLYT
ncbi:p-coumarate 3-hydroxylase-like [Macadamia integrifolia]|uniref:p-coumarate 3-hydroxylase-like n=1 Tax=Macadamia integrifolia TaxID=60698 RepID=UPI001C5304F8|nr:p-coumarate 3-hydroxylase-like [Macadamia integrifolia]